MWSGEFLKPFEQQTLFDPKMVTSIWYKRVRMRNLVDGWKGSGIEENVWKSKWTDASVKLGKGS